MKLYRKSHERSILRRIKSDLLFPGLERFPVPAHLQPGSAPYAAHRSGADHLPGGALLRPNTSKYRSVGQIDGCYRTKLFEFEHSHFDPK